MDGGATGTGGLNGYGEGKEKGGRECEKGQLKLKAI